MNTFLDRPKNGSKKEDAMFEIIESELSRYSSVEYKEPTTQQGAGPCLHLTE